MNAKDQWALDALLKRLRNVAESSRRQANMEADKGGHISHRFALSAEEAETEFYALRRVLSSSFDISKIELATKPVNSRKIVITIHDIIVATVDHFGLTDDEIVSRKRNKIIMVPRQIAIYLARELTLASYQTIATQFGLRCHATALHARNKIRGLVEANDPDTVVAIQAIRCDLLQNESEETEDAETETQDPGPVTE